MRAQRGLTRRDATGAAVGLLFAAGASRAAFAGKRHSAAEDVSAAEDMMREHGVLRRALLIYAETARQLRKDPTSVDPKPLNDTANLFRTFGEDYHERRLEEAYVFPSLQKTGGAVAKLADLLVDQHKRGREITGYILDVTDKGVLGVGTAEVFANALDAQVVMYQNHAAREDTIVFPAWKAVLSARQLNEMSEKFEDIEHQLFGKDGFEDAVQRIASIEEALGFADLAQFTAPPPPAR